MQVNYTREKMLENSTTEIDPTQAQEHQSGYRAEIQQAQLQFFLLAESFIEKVPIKDYDSRIGKFLLWFFKRNFLSITWVPKYH